MREEIELIKENHTWELTELSRGHRAIRLRWVLVQAQEGQIRCGDQEPDLPRRQGLHAAGRRRF
jgi:hypothetical protein